MTTSLKKINEMADRLIELRESANGAYAVYKEACAERDLLQDELMKSLKSNDVKSIKRNDVTLSLAERSRLVVLDEKMVIDDLKNKGLTDYYSIRLNDLFSKSLSYQLARKGEKLAGTEIATTEYVSIRTGNKPKDADNSDQ